MTTNEKSKNPPSATRNNRNVDRKWSRLCIQHLKPNGAGVGKIFEELRSCGNYEHLVEHSIVRRINKYGHGNLEKKHNKTKKELRLRSIHQRSIQSLKPLLQIFNIPHHRCMPHLQLIPLALALELGYITPRLIAIACCFPIL